MSKIDAFWNAINSEEGKELMKNANVPENEEEAAELYSSIAEKLGVKAPKGDVLNILKVKEQIQQKLTEKAESSLKEALDESQLDNVAGGELSGKQISCESTFNPEGEWCWVSDSCSVLITDYNDVANNPYDPKNNPDDLTEFLDFENPDWNIYDCDELYKPKKN